MNIYIETLSFANSRTDTEGITYNQTVEYLKSKGYNMDADFEEYFLLWFYENFYEKYAYSTLRNGNPNQINNLVDHLRIFQDKKVKMNASGFSTLQDFYKLERAQKDASKANIVSVTALIVTVLVGLVQIFLQLITN